MQRLLSQRNCHGLSSLALVLSAFFGVSANETARAVPITYSLTTTASGELGSTAFNNATVTITATADTSSIGSYTPVGYPTPVYYAVQDLTCSVFISGLGTADFTSATMTYLTPLTSVIGITSGNDILDAQVNGAFLDYNLATDFGPVSGDSIQSSSGAVGDSFATDMGTFVLTSLTTNTVVGFDAYGGPAEVAMPEHNSTLGLLLLGLSGIAGQVWINKIRRTPRRI